MKPTRSIKWTLNQMDNVAEFCAEHGFKAGLTACKNAMAYVEQHAKNCYVEKPRRSRKANKSARRARKIARK